MSIKKTTQKGFSTMEFLIYVGLFGILFTIIGQIFTSAIDVQTQAENVSYVNMDGQHIMSRLEYDIGRATSVTTPTSLGTTGSTLQIIVNGATRTYSLSSGNILLDGVQLNGFATTVTALSFQRIGNVGGRDTVRVSLTLSSNATTAQGTTSQTFATTYAIR